jgi:hypothetical protein
MFTKSFFFLDVLCVFALCVKCVQSCTLCEELCDFFFVGSFQGHQNVQGVLFIGVVENCQMP